MTRLLAIGWLSIVVGLVVSLAGAAEFAWTGMRNPCKVSAEDGLTQRQLGRKIGRFVLLPDKEAWGQAIFNVHNRFPESRPWVTWGVGPIRDARPLTDEQHEEYLAHMDALGVDVFLEISPNRGDDVPANIDQWLAKFKHHPCVKGLGVDLEFYQRVDDATAEAWDARVKAANPEYRLFFKHWEQGYMPPNYRGGDVIFINTSSEATPEALNEEFAAWARHFAPAAVAFQIGYPSDEDGMDGDNTKGWFKFEDPLRDWGQALLTKIGDTGDQQIGLLWVCVKSGKTYNADWDLTRGAKLPAAASPAAASQEAR